MFWSTGPRFFVFLKALMYKDVQLTRRGELTVFTAGCLDQRARSAFSLAVVMWRVKVTCKYFSHSACERHSRSLPGSGSGLAPLPRRRSLSHHAVCICCFSTFFYCKLSTWILYFFLFYTIKIRRTIFALWCGCSKYFTFYNEKLYFEKPLRVKAFRGSHTYCVITYNPQHVNP